MENIKFRVGNYMKFPINLFVNIGGSEPITMRVGDAVGASQCVLYVESVDEIDSVINQLVEIKNKINSNGTK